MEENIQNQAIENLRKEFEDLTEKFQPQFTDISKPNKKISLIEFWNLIYQKINDTSYENSAKMTVEIGGQQFSFLVDKMAMIRTVEECFSKFHKENFVYLEPQEFKEKSREVYGMFSFMLDSMKENALQMQTVGHKYLSMNFESNGTKYASFLPIQEAIDFLSTIQPVNMFENMPEIPMPIPDLTPPKIPPGQALYLTVKVTNKMLDKIPELLEARYGNQSKEERLQDEEFWTMIIDGIINQIRPDYMGDYENFETTPEICEQVIKDHPEEIQALMTESPNVKKQWEELAERKKSIIKEFLSKS